MHHKCVHCGSLLADKLVLRDDYGTIRGSATHEEAFTMLHNLFAQLEDQGKDPSIGWECAGCRKRFLDEDKAEREEYEERKRFDKWGNWMSGW